MSHFHWLGLIALGAAIVKTLVLFRARSTTAASSAFCLLALALILESSLEFSVSLAVSAGPESLNTSMNGVIFAIYLSLLAILNFALVASRNIHRKNILTFFALWASVLVILQLNETLITGFKITEYSVVSVPGKYYVYFPSYALASVFVSGVALASGIRLGGAIARRCRVAFNSLGLLLLVLGSVSILKVLGYEASTGVVLPITTTIFLWVLLLDERNEFIILETRLQQRWVVTLIKWRTIFRLALNMKGIEPSKWHEEVDDSLLRGALQRAGTKQDAAELLGMARTTLHSKLKKSGIE